MRRKRLSIAVRRGCSDGNLGQCYQRVDWMCGTTENAAANSRTGTTALGAFLPRIPFSRETELLRSPTCHVSALEHPIHVRVPYVRARFSSLVFSRECARVNSAHPRFPRIQKIIVRRVPRTVTISACMIVIWRVFRLKFLIFKTEEKWFWLDFN